MTILIRTLAYSMTVKKPDGSFEKLEASGDIMGDSDVAFIDLQSFVKKNLGLESYQQDDMVEEHEEVKTPAKRTRRTKAEIQAEKEQEAEAEVEETEAEEEEVEEEEVEEVKTPTKKGKAPKTVAYSREDDSLKQRLSELLHEKYPNWKADKAMVASAKKASTELVGEAMLDEKGEVLDSFIEALETLMESDL